MSRDLRRGPNWFQFTSSQNMNEDKWPLVSACFLMLFWLACVLVPETWHIFVNEGIISLLTFFSKKRHGHSELRHLILILLGWYKSIDQVSMNRTSSYAYMHEVYILLSRFSKLIEWKKPWKICKNGYSNKMAREITVRTPTSVAYFQMVEEWVDNVV